MDSDDITLEPQATSEYDSAVVKTENHNEDAAQNTETLGYENFDWGLFRVPRIPISPSHKDRPPGMDLDSNV